MAAPPCSTLFPCTSLVRSATATTTYYVSCTSADSCVGPRTPVTATVNTLPAAPTVTGATICGPGSVTLTASGCTGGSLHWFTAATGGSPIFTGSSFVVNATATTTYYVSCTSADSCVGPRTAVTATVNPGPPAPTTTGEAMCGACVFILHASGCDGGTLT